MNKDRELLTAIEKNQHAIMARLINIEERVNKLGNERHVEVAETAKSLDTILSEQLSLFAPDAEETSEKKEKLSNCRKGHRIDAIATYFGISGKAVSEMMKSIGATHFFYGDMNFKHRYYTNEDISKIRDAFHLHRKVDYVWRYVG